MGTYITVSGDTWDTIARAVYKDEMKASYLMKTKENMPLLDYQVFPAGVTVYVPEIPVDSVYDDDLPDWRKD